MSTATSISIQAGEPYELVVRYTGGKLVWTNLADCEVRSQIRRYHSATSNLMLDLTPHLTVTADGDDIVIRLSLTGALTRTMSGGYYDMVISDVGETDARALVLIHGTVDITPIVTSAS